MNFNKTSNPTLGEKIIKDYAFAATDGAMTVQGTINKIALLLALVIAGAVFTWAKTMSGVETGSVVGVQGWMIGGSISAFILALIITFKKNLAPILSPVYAICEGLCLGALSAYFEVMFPGLVMRAVLLTFSVLFGMLFMYKVQIIKVTQRFRAIVLAATVGIALAYLISFILNLFGVNMGFILGGGSFGLIISLVVVAVAALNLVLDFDFIEKGTEAGLPSFFEWYGAFGLMVTLIWLYIEILRLLATIASNRN
ncbi:MAG: Bax inhibitor-1/YccA family protein [Salinivirgaceae bacterium]|nr:Bax inhibitor-1/YccA family protein [Salinivirgaceae bacterium]